jgi:hypothetical protein
VEAYLKIFIAIAVLFAASTAQAKEPSKAQLEKMKDQCNTEVTRIIVDTINAECNGNMRSACGQKYVATKESVVMECMTDKIDRWLAANR